jgi:hypothetical protein
VHKLEIAFRLEAILICQAGADNLNILGLTKGSIIKLADNVQESLVPIHGSNICRQRLVDIQCSRYLQANLTDENEVIFFDNLANFMGVYKSKHQIKEIKFDGVHCLLVLEKVGVRRLSLLDS